MSLDFKLKTLPRCFQPPLPPLVVIEPPPPPPSPLPFWNIATRLACVLAIAPLLLLPRSTDGAASVHLLTIPATAYIFQRYHHLRYTTSILYGILPCVCVLLGNAAAVLLLLGPHLHDHHAEDVYLQYYYYTKFPLLLLAILLTLAVAQQLWLVEKRAPPRLMLCTATAMLVLALAYLGVWAPTFMMARRFFQSTTLPLLLLLMETFRLPATTSRALEQPPCA